MARDIVESILDAAEPDGLSVEKLYGMLVGREEQRKAVGSAGVRPHESNRDRRSGGPCASASL